MSLEQINNLARSLKYQPIKPKNFNSGEAELTRLKKACQDFETILVSQLLKGMRGSSEDTNLFGTGAGNDFYQGMFETELAKNIAGSSGIGLAKVLYRQLTGKELSGKSDASSDNTIKKSINVKSKKPAFEQIKVFDNIIRDAATKHNIPLHLAYGLIAQESSGNPNDISKAGAKGLCQLMDETAKDLGVKNSFDPRENIMGGMRYLRDQLNKFNGDQKLALAAYNAGPGNVTKYGGIPPFKETREYVVKVLNYAEQFKPKLGAPAI